MSVYFGGNTRMPKAGMGVKVINPKVASVTSVAEYALNCGRTVA